MVRQASQFTSVSPSQESVPFPPSRLSVPGSPVRVSSPGEWPLWAVGTTCAPQRCLRYHGRVERSCRERRCRNRRRYPQPGSRRGWVQPRPGGSV